MVKHIAARVGQNPDPVAATEAVSAAAFKADVKTAVLTAMHARPTGKYTVAEYLNILWPAVTEFPNQLPKYLHTPLHRGAQLKLLFRAGVAPVAHTAAKRTKTSSACAFCDGCANEKAEHFTLECPAFEALRQQLLTATRAWWASKSSGPGASCHSRSGWCPAGDQWWGTHAETGDEWIQTYLLHLESKHGRSG